MYFLKLSPDILYEGIITYYIQDRPYAVPLGFKILEKDKIMLKIFKNSKTYNFFINENPDLVINLTFNPMLYIITAFKDALREEYENIKYVNAYKVKAPRISSEHEVWGYIEARIIEKGDRNKGYLEVILNVEHIDAFSRFLIIEPLSRIYNHMIDVAVYLTKIASTTYETYRKYVELLKYSLGLINENCRTEACIEFMDYVNRVFKYLINEKPELQNVINELGLR